MCHRDQKSDGDVAKNGLLKFRGILKPSIAAAPIAISEYPEKSQYTCIPKAIEPRIIENDSRPIGFEKILFTNGAMLSAKNIFLKKPIAIKVTQNFSLELWMMNNRNRSELFACSIFSFN